jgi:hypothetical protein
VVELSIVNKGAELLEPFAVSIVLGDPAAQQFAAALSELLVHLRGRGLQSGADEEADASVF